VTLGGNESGQSQSVDTRVAGTPGMEPNGGGGGEQERANRLGLTESRWRLQGEPELTPLMGVVEIRVQGRR